MIDTISPEHFEIEALLERPDLFDDYLADIAARRAANRKRRLREYWRCAAERLTMERDAAIEDGDLEMIAELERAIGAFRQALAPLPAPEQERPSPAPEEPLPAPIPADQATRHQPEAAEAPVPSVEAVLITEAQREEAARMAQDLLMRADAFLSSCDRPGISQTLALRLTGRALYCETGMLLADPALSGEHEPQVRQIHADLIHLYGNGRHEFLFTLSGMPPEVWSGLAQRYHSCASAADALAWYMENLERIDLPDRVRLLDGIAAAQGRLFRFQEFYGGKDPCQIELFKKIMDLRDTAGWLEGLHPNTSDETLEYLAGGLDAVCQEIRAAVADEDKRAEQKAHREDAIQAVIAWEESLEGRAITTGTLDADRASLFSLLDACIAAAVPPTNPTVRAALLYTAPVLLDGEPRFAKFLEAVAAERGRQGLDPVEVEGADEEQGDTGRADDFDAVRQQVTAFTRGKKVLMLGGKTRERTCRELSEALGCEVAWPGSEETDKPKKFDAALTRADLVLLVKNFARHSLFYHAKDRAGKDGKPFIVLPSGYGVRQVVSQIQEYVERGGRGTCA